MIDYEREKKQKFSIWKFFSENPKEAVTLTKRAIIQILDGKGEYPKENEINILIDKSELEISVSQAIKNKFINKLILIQARITGESEVKTRLVKGIWFCRDLHETESNAKPISTSDQALRLPLLENISERPIARMGKATEAIFTLNPKMDINHAVMVVPIFAPIITPMD